MIAPLQKYLPLVGSVFKSIAYKLIN